MRISPSVAFATLLTLSTPHTAAGQEPGADPRAAQSAAAFDRCDFASAAALARGMVEEQESRWGPADQRLAPGLVLWARALVYEPDYEEAEALFRRALSIQSAEDGDPDAAASTMSELARLLADRGNWAEADSLASLSVRTRARADALAALGYVRLAMGHFVQADSLLSEAVDLAVANLGPTALHTLGLRLERADALVELNLGRTEDIIDEILPQLIQKLGPNHLRVANCYAMMGRLYYSYRRLDIAQEWFDKSLAVKREIFPANHPAIAEELNNIGVMAMIRGEHAEGEPYLREALAIYRETRGNDDEEVAFQLSQLAVNLSEQGRYLEAEPLYAECEAIYRAIDPGHPDLLWAISYQGRDALRRKDFAKAEELFNESVNARLALELRDGDLTNEYMMLVETRVGRDDFEGAEEYLELATENWEVARLRSGRDVHRATSRHSPWEAMALARLATNRVEEAWPAIERSRGRVVADLVFERHDELGTAREGASASSSFPFSLERVQSVLEPNTAVVGWIDHALPGGETESWAYVIRSEGRVQWIRLPSPQSDAELAERAREVRLAVAGVGASPLGAPTHYDSAARDELYRTHFQPIESSLNGIEELILIPSPGLSTFPFAMLRSQDGRFVGERFRIAYAPSATIACWLREKPKRIVRSGLLIGDPPFQAEHLAEMENPELVPPEQPMDLALLRSARAGDRAALSSLPRLRWSRRELESAESYFPESTTIVGAEATTARLDEMVARSELERYDVIHIATHALVDASDWKSCSLIFSQLTDDEADPGIVTGEVVSDQWTLDAEAVVLSACETGLGQSVAAEGTVGFSYAFLRAGARSLLVSLWKVDDRATSLLMQKFYEKWLGSEDGTTASSKTAALRSAQAWLRDYEGEDGSHPYEHPYYWAAFVLIGDGR